uniref:Odorant-binding protein 12 n=1 Tax=Pyrrhalta aenescens TaxID=281545 RepID=A0A1J0KKL0_9CUCU|nr:odorant-binding protein 12 [Pyrrhalta aenescens]
MFKLLFKFVFYLFLVGYFTSEAAAPKLNHPKIQEAVVKCSKDKAIDRKTLLEALNVDQVDAKLKDYNLCILKGSGVIESDGKINLAVAKEFSEMFFPDKVDIIMKTCCVVKENADETALWISKCLLNLKLI